MAASRATTAAAGPAAHAAAPPAPRQATAPHPPPTAASLLFTFGHRQRHVPIAALAAEDGGGATAITSLAAALGVPEGCTIVGFAVAPRGSGGGEDAAMLLPAAALSFLPGAIPSNTVITVLASVPAPTSSVTLVLPDAVAGTIALALTRIFGAHWAIP